MTTTYRAEIPVDTMPDPIKALPTDRGYPVPWFVAWIDGKADFRVLKPGATVLATKHDTCWICGERMGTYRTWPIGPMCAVNRVTAEPPCHPDCADWSVRVCPFLARPHARRREAGLPEEALSPAGTMIRRNPGVICLWKTKGRPAKKALFPVPGGGYLFNVGEPVELGWIAEGRDATREEILESINSGLPLLEASTEQEADPLRVALAKRDLRKQVNKAMELVPA
jgi:hypothetical protein